MSIHGFRFYVLASLLIFSSPIFAQAPVTSAIVRSHSSTACSVDSEIQDLTNNQKYDLHSDLYYVEAKWIYQDMTFRLRNYFLDEKQLVVQPVVEQSLHQKLSDTGTYSVSQSEVATFGVNAAGTIRKATGGGKDGIELLPNGDRQYYTIDIAGRSVLIAKQTPLSADSYKLDDVVSAIPVRNDMQVLSSGRACTVVQIIDDLFPNDPGILFNSMLAQFSTSLELLEKADLALTICLQSSAACTSEKTKASKERIAMKKVWTGLVSERKLKSLDIISERRRAEAERREEQRRRSEPPSPIDRYRSPGTISADAQRELDCMQSEMTARGTGINGLDRVIGAICRNR